jgi:hypothetical protein
VVAPVSGFVTVVTVGVATVVFVPPRPRPGP